MKSAMVQPIQRLRQRFPDEWLLIAVDRFDSHTTTPLTGRLVAHSKSPDLLEKQAVRTKGLTYLVFGRDTFPQGYAAAF